MTSIQSIRTMIELAIFLIYSSSTTAFQSPWQSIAITKRYATRRDILQITPLSLLFLHANKDNINDPKTTSKQNELPTDDELTKATLTSSSILKSMRERTPAFSCASPNLLNLATDFYDPTTGLHSEGVWHNSLVGIASLSLSIPSDGIVGNEWMNVDAAKRIADSLWGYSWDGVSFQRRCWSGLWDHSPLLEIDASDSSSPVATLVQPNYYRSSPEHRCVQHGMALLFWSSLVTRHLGKDDDDYNRYKEQYDLISKSFLQQYWDSSIDKWRTVSLSQGGGTTLRSSASLGKLQTSKSSDVTNGDKEVVYYRAVDQAVAVLACLGMLKVLKQEGDMTEYNRVDTIIRNTCQTLLSNNGFGYGRENDARSYLGINRNRNFWHDGWVLLALTCARTHVWPKDPNIGESELRLLLQSLIRRYGHSSGNDKEIRSFDGTIWHWDHSLKPDTNSGNVRYCGDNALLYAIIRNINWIPEEAGMSVSEYQLSFWDFVKDLRSRDKDGLASVADAYPQVRLHPNTELAALVLWQ